MVEEVFTEDQYENKHIVPSTVRARFFTDNEDDESSRLASTDFSEITDRKLHFDEDDAEEKQKRKSQIEEESERPGIRLEHREPPKPCYKYLNLDEFAQRFVSELTDEAIKVGSSLRVQSSIRIIEGLEVQGSSSELSSLSSTVSVGTYVCVIQWPTIQEFTPDLGLSRIEEYVSFWVVKEDWKNCTNYLGGLSDETCDYHDYEVIFSIPCKQYPVPQATASVFFTLEVSRVRPKECLVDVYYNFEGSRLKHFPGKYPFQEIWLFNIVDAKLKLFKKNTF